MARVVISSPADADTAAILIDLATKAGVNTAAKYDRLFDRLYDRLADHPASGPRRPALGPDTRIGIVSPYIVIYDYSEGDDTVTILRIVHGHRDITRKLLGNRD